MQLACPACHTAFHIDPAALGAKGRTVRCARCRNTWLARPEDLIPAPAMAEVSAEGEADLADGVKEGAAAILPQVAPMNDMIMVDVHPSPSLAPGVPIATAVPASGLPGRALDSAAPVSGRRRFARGDRQQTRLGLVA